ncbi:hypothetical protein O181_000628 [Austropuccinia psidii MF-1]|uniref:beta-glucosidase n=1 Tax=Austropuccinia psidii MF-1 TaxID=1389203 RepID=A0A9Q3GB14_9BASI|nr:hypothetical protein [Austropuccinia psidii MF-1]
MKALLALVLVIKSPSFTIQFNPFTHHITAPPSPLLPTFPSISSFGFNFTVVAPPPGYEAWTSPVILPSPIQGGHSAWSGVLARARYFVSQLTIEEKVNLTTGAGIQGRCVGETGTVPRLGFDQPICLQDGPVGVRLTDRNSVFPAGINAASTFDKKLIYARARAMGLEFRNKGVNVALAPMTNLMRTPTGGRAWEGCGADPYLCGVTTAQSVLGIQSAQVSACIKHYIGNEQEHYRGGSGSITSSSNMDDRTLYQIYDWPFAEGIAAGSDYLMCSYNRINQTYACENSKLLNGLVKGQHGFQGVVVTDWAAAASGVRTALAGADMNMPSFIAYGMPSESNPSVATHSYWGANLVEAIKNGSVPLERIDDMVTRIISTYYKQGQDKPDYPKLNFVTIGQGTAEERETLDEHINVQADHYNLIREIGAASTIILKNVNNALPLKPPKEIDSIVVIGSDAGDNPQGPNSCTDRACNNGTLAVGWGSGSAEFSHLIAPSTAIQNYVMERNPTITYQAIFDDFAYSKIGNASAHADVALVHVNSNSGEGYLTVDGNMGDRNNISLWNAGHEMILKAAEVCRNVIVIIHAVGPVEMECWINHPNVTGVLFAGLPGQETGNSEVDVLWGKVNPSGRLPFTIAKSRTDYPADVLYNSTMAVPQVTYSEKSEIDYRHFDAKSITPRFEFGFGLSYTNFKYHSLAIYSSVRSQNSWENLLERVVKVRFQLTNIGSRPGHEVAQLYLGFPNHVKEPPKVLRGFERVFLDVQQTSRVVLHLRRKDISYWDVVSQSWRIPHGEFKIMIGASSRHILLEEVLNMDV